MAKIFSNTIILFFIMLSSAYAQVKFEQEYSIKEEEVPKEALFFISTAFGSVKQKWHKEVSQNGKSIETRIKKNKKKYSIEFDTLGNIQDVEITISARDISEKIVKKIRDNLKDKFTKFKIIKTQTQWTGNTQDLIKTIAENIAIGSVNLHYEILIKASKNNEITKYYETLFDADGMLKSVVEVLERNDDNLIY